MATTDTNVPQVIVNKLTSAEYATATKSPTEFYAVTDGKIETADIADGAVTVAKTSAETIWTGTASGANTVLNLSHPIYDYKYLLIRFGGAINRTKCELFPVEQSVTNNEFNLWLQQSTSVYTGCSLSQSTDTTGATLTITNSNHAAWAENIIYEVKGIK